MSDDFTLKMSFLSAAVLGAVSLFLSRYLKSDPTVRFLRLSFSATPERFHTSSAQRYPNHRVF